MKNLKEVLKNTGIRAGALALALMMTLSMSSFAVEAVFADSGEEACGAALQAETEQTSASASGDSEAEAAKAEDAPAADLSGEDGTVDKTSREDAGSEDAGSEAGTAPADTEDIQPGTAKDSGDTATGPEGAADVAAEADTQSETMQTQPEPVRKQAALASQTEPDQAAQPQEEIPEYDESRYPALTDRTLTVGEKIVFTDAAGNQSANLRELLGESYKGYAVAQGGCTDGTYAYYLMVSSYNQKGRIVKVRLSDNRVMSSSDVIDICHGNGMTYDAAKRQLVIVGREERRNQLTLVNVGDGETDAPSFAGYAYVDYSEASKADKWNKGTIRGDGERYGLSAISYIKSYDCYVALQRSTHDLLVLDRDYKVIGFIGTKITAKYPGTYQAMDADDRYVYLLLSSYNSSQPDNVIVALDWNAEHIADMLRQNAAAKDGGFLVTYIADPWKCNNDGGGTPDAAIKIAADHEAENIFHVHDPVTGAFNFYYTEYFNDPQYKITVTREPYKVKWKKVTKKVKVKWKKVWKKVKWKKVKIKGKWKWKYKKKKVWKYKTKKKKVWKYKTKYKTVENKVFTHYNRQSYVYFLGSLCR